MRGASIHSADVPAPYFMYGVPYGQANGAYGTYIQPNAKPKPEPPKTETKVVETKPRGIEEQERVLVVDEMTEKSFNPRWQGRVTEEARVEGGQTGYVASGSAALAAFEYSFARETTPAAAQVKEVPRIVTDVI